MKIRIRGNSIRFRLTKSEVDTFCQQGFIEATTDFGDSVFKYALKSKKGIETIDAEFKENTVILYLEQEISKNWNNSSQVGFNHSLKKENNTILNLLIEKDFVCMDESVEDQSDNYPNPKMILK